ncbi:MAG: LamG-like jellyroll fold domain-containing protein, partial [Verrucomicrobiota bacterium]
MEFLRKTKARFLRILLWICGIVVFVVVPGLVLHLGGSTTSVNVPVSWPDDDNDGLPNYWEDQYGLDRYDDGSIDINNGPMGDPDGDGLLNIEEFREASHPQDKNSPVDFGVFEPVEWTSFTGFADATSPSDGNSTVEKTSGGNVWDSGALGTQSNDSDVRVRFRFPQTNKAVMVGLSSADAGGSYTSIDYAIYGLYYPAIQIYEKGVYRTTIGEYSSDSVFAVERKGSTVRYYCDNNLIYTSNVPSVGPLTPDFASYFPGGAATNIKVTVPTPPDLDDDGLPDPWEIEHFGDLSKTGEGNEDPDGLTNLGEYLAGTDPMDRDSNDDGLNDELDYGLAGYWPFDEGSGNVASDDSGNGHVGVISGGGGWEAQGAIGGALVFADEDSKVLLEDGYGNSLPVDLGDEWTISAWFSAPLPSTGTWHTLSRGINPGADHQVILDSSLIIGTYDNGASQFVPSDSGYAASAAYGSRNWHHLVAVGSGSQTEYFVDGVFVGVSPYKSITNVYCLGNYQAGGQRFADKLDEVRVYQRALSHSEIIALRNHDANNDGMPDFNLAPSISISSPTAGQSFYPGESLVIVWQASDPDSDNLSVSVSMNGSVISESAMAHGSQELELPAGAAAPASVSVTVTDVYGGVGIDSVIAIVEIITNDGDSMDDRWEADFGLNPNANDGAFDYDFDGFSNAQEFANGTDPLVYDASNEPPYGITLSLSESSQNEWYGPTGDVASGDSLGGHAESIALEGDLLVVGYPYEEYVATLPGGALESRPSAGAARLYQFNSVTDDWEQVASIAESVSDGRHELDYFGFSVAFEGDIIAIGAPGDSINEDGGAVFIYEYDSSGGSLIEVQKIAPAEGATDGMFGRTVALTGEWLVVGGAAESGDYIQGAIYIFRWNGVTESWDEHQKITGPWLGGLVGHISPFSSDMLAVDGDRIVAYYGGSSLGYPYADFVVFELDIVSQIWEEKSVISVPLPSGNVEAPRMVGRLAISGDTIVVGAPRIWHGSGGVLVYGLDSADGNWYQVDGQTMAPGWKYGEVFGLRVSIDGDRMAVGSVFADQPIVWPTISRATGMGAIYIYEREPASGVWSEVGVHPIAVPDFSSMVNIELDSWFAVGAPVPKSIESGGGDIMLRDSDSLSNIFSVPEGSLPGTFIANISAIDPDGDELEFVEIGDPSNVFQIEQSGEFWRLIVGAGAQLNYEDAASHEVEIEVSDGLGGSSRGTFTIHVEDLDDDDDDSDGLPNWWELQYGLNPQSPGDELGDTGDGDELNYLQEFQAGTSPDEADSDGDGLPDELEFGILARWKLEEIAGELAYDTSPNGNHAHVIGGDWTASGQSGGGLEFGDGIGRLQLAEGLEPGDEWTISVWFRAPLPEMGEWHALTRGLTSGYHIMVDPSLNLGTMPMDGGGFRSSGFDLGDLKEGWHHLAAI